MNVMNELSRYFLPVYNYVCISIILQLIEKMLQYSVQQSNSQSNCRVVSRSDFKCHKNKPKKCQHLHRSHLFLDHNRRTDFVCFIYFMLCYVCILVSLLHFYYYLSAWHLIDYDSFYQKIYATRPL